MSTPPVFSITTSQTFLNYSITETPLNLYMKYVWRVKAKDNIGRDWFKNEGKSQICMFTYGNAKNVLGDVLRLVLNAETINHRAGQCDWNRQSAFTNYLLQVRKVGTNYWFDYPNAIGIERVGNLEPSTTYECRVRGMGSGITGEWSNLASFTTSGPPVFSCNDPAMPYNTAPNDPLPDIKAIRGLIFQSGQFEVITTHIQSSGTAGWYKGKGFVKVFGKKFSVKWDNIYLDLDSRHQQGIIEAETKGIDNWLQQWDLTVAEGNANYVNGTIDSVYINGGEVCYTLQGNNNAICIPTPSNSNAMVIRDGDGNQYLIQLNPPPKKVIGPASYLNYSADSLSATENQIVYFEESNNQNYGFDKKEYAAFIENYEVIKLHNGKNYFVANKSIGEGWADEVLARIEIENYNPSLLNFKIANGTLLTVTTANVPGYLKITGIPANTECIYAYYNSKRIGKLNVFNLKAVSKKLVLVPVNGSPLPVAANNQGESALNAVFKQANVNWSITAAANFTFNLGNDGLQIADTKLLNKYSAEMKDLREAYKKFDTLYDKDAYYLFVVPGFSDPNVRGYMVRGRALGFVAVNANVKNIAHELAHGAFALEHTFPDIEKGSSNNLMDYNVGRNLVKKQWMQIQFCNFEIKWFDEEEDAALFGKSFDNAAGVFYWINKIKVAYKNSNKVTIPANTGFIGKTQICYLGGMQFDSVSIYMQKRGVEYDATVKNSVVIGTNSTTDKRGIVSTYSCILIDGGKIIIKVPYARLNNMKVYIESSITMKNLILFVNGYRPIVNMNGDPMTIVPPMEYEDSNNQIEHGDSRDYWKGIDAQFMNRIGTRNAVYADGNHSVGTSNHYSILRYGGANLESLLLQKHCESSPRAINCINPPKGFLHTVPNIAGFTYRASKGTIAGLDLVQKINEGVIVFDKQTDTLDVVSHSMGYAYAVGIITELKKANINLGRFYIIAPENACSGGLDWSIFREVWQYGSNLGEADQDAIWYQDGVAPQCPVPGLDIRYSNTKTGRAFIPKEWKPKGFLDSHSIKNYTWIFTERKPGMKGYVNPR